MLRLRPQFILSSLFYYSYGHMAKIPFRLFTTVQPPSLSLSLSLSLSSPSYFPYSDPLCSLTELSSLLRGFLPPLSLFVQRAAIAQSQWFCTLRPCLSFPLRRRADDGDDDDDDGEGNRHDDVEFGDGAAALP